jgi:predicted nucleic acid-binding protein
LTDAAPRAIDTSVAIPLLVISHPRHAAIKDWARNRELSLSGHAHAETYAVLTRLPGDAQVDPNDAVLLMEDNFAPPLVLSARAARAVHRELALGGVSGGATYDGLVALAAREHHATLATRDARARSTYEVLRVPVELLP